MADSISLLRKLQMEPHPEGGYFKETFRSQHTFSKTELNREGPERSYATSILYLLMGRDVSKMHRLQSDEIWYFHAGSGCFLHIISPEGEYEKVYLSLDVENGGIPQAVVPAGSWFGAEVADRRDFCLVGCAMAPGFDFADWEMGNGEELCQQYPQHAEWIRELT